ncbi:MAG: PAS domain S-box protein [Bacillota bacterium]
MTLRGKTMLITGLTLAVLLLILYSLPDVIMMGSMILAPGLVFGAVIMLFLERVILSRLSRIIAAVGEIGQSSDFSARVKVQGNDELSRLAFTINGMLGALEVSRDKLLATREHYKELFDLLPVVVCEINMDGIITLTNAKAVEMFGYSMEELCSGFYALQVVVPEEREKAKRDMERVFAGEKPGGQEYTVKRKDGKKFSVVIHSRPIVRENRVVGLRSTLADITAIRSTKEALRESEERYRTILESIEDGYIEVDLKGALVFFNSSACRIIGYSSEELTGKGYKEYTVPGHIPRVRRAFNQVYKTGRPFKLLDWLVSAKDGSVRCLESSVSLIKDMEGNPTGFRGVVRDVTERKQFEEKLRDSEEKYRLVFENSPLGIIHFNKDGIITACNDKMLEITGTSREDLVGVNMLISSDHQLAEVTKKALSGEQSHYEVNYRVRTSGRIVPVKVDFSPITLEDNTVIGGVCIVEDITERKQAVERLKYLSFHDSLTGVYNRVYFEREMRRIEAEGSYPAGVIICDVDGLKLVNDTLGHDAGDALLVDAAAAIRESFRDSDVVARIGGDEFAVLLPNSSRTVVEGASRRIREAVRRRNHARPELLLSVSIGFSVSRDGCTDMNELFKEADNNMYREKLHSSQSARSAIVQTLMKALEARDFITEGHADRLQDLVVGLASAIGMPVRGIADLRLLAQFHDIGKVGIPDRILFKPGPLDREEAAEMQRHCEIGHRIALSAPDLAPVADWILKHHERWDGKGYPLGLKREEIPLECRILAIADAYDAMTSDRPYRKAKSYPEAISELRRCSGTQFDPHLVAVFLEVVKPVPVKKS